MASSTRRSRGRGAGVPAGAPASEATVEKALRAELTVARNDLGLLAQKLAESAPPIPFGESTADLERQINADPGWRLFSVLTQQEFTPDGMRQLRSVCRLMAIANPLIKRGLNLRAVYVHGQGCQITARANGRAPAEGQEAEQDVNAVVDAFVQDPANQRAVFGQQAASELERALGTDGEVFVALFTRPASGWVQARTIVADDITEIITNPDDASEPWFYRRVWSKSGYDAAGNLQWGTEELLYPDVDYKPARQPPSFAGVKIKWDAPIVHVAVNRPHGWQRGIPDAYASINWARAYKQFLEQWAQLMRSLARFAWALTAEGKDREQAKAAITAAGTSRNVVGEPNTAGGVALTPLNAKLEAIPKTGAQIDAESGRPLAMMVAAGLDVPVTMLLADPGQTGARATAETLDWPTELCFMDRRQLWTDTRQRIVRHVVTEAVRAAKGPLKGTIVRDPVTDREVVTLAADTDDTVDVVWPDLDEQDPKAIIDAVVAAAGTGTVPPELVLRLLLQALGVRDVESILAEMVDEQGNFRWPQTATPPGPGQQAADAARDGGDPAAVGPGSMGPDGEPEPPAPEVDGVSSEAIARQADADFGLFGGRGTDQADPAAVEPDGPGEQPADTYDPEFFRI